MRSRKPEPALVDDDGDDVVVEAPSAAAALEAVTARLGDHAHIVEADKVLRGGLGGFFAREMVQLRARRTHGEQPAAPAGGTAIDRLLEGLTAETGAREETFAEALRRQLGPTPEPAQASAEAPADAPSAPAAPPAAPAAPGWFTPFSVDALLRLGLPSSLVQHLDVVEPRDDPAWLGAIARRMEPLCRPLPGESPLLVGPRAHRLASALGYRVHEGGDPSAAGGLGLRIQDGTRGRARLDELRYGRAVHLVVGGSGWQRLLFDDPVAVSWVGEEALPDAVRVAAELGIGLGYGLSGAAGGQVVVAAPMEIALALRALLPWR